MTKGGPGRPASGNGGMAAAPTGGAGGDLAGGLGGPLGAGAGGVGGAPVSGGGGDAMPSAADGFCFYQAAGAPSACGAGTVCERLAPATCADPNWAEWPVPPSTAPSAYTDNSDGTVTDNVTGLMWQQRLGGLPMTQAAAVTYCSTMVATGGHHDWRLPTKIELLSIVDYGRSNPAINPVFTMTPPTYWWSSTIAAGTSRAWVVYFGDGDTNNFATEDTAFFRCVR